MRRTKEHSQETADKLLDIARIRFTEHGYAKASLEEIVAEAGMTRGALYHHYGNKLGLFKAVVSVVQAELGEKVEREASRSDDPLEQLILGCKAFVEAHSPAGRTCRVRVGNLEALGRRERDAASSRAARDFTGARVLFRAFSSRHDPLPVRSA
jgi:AcrR family transcriptional regulator